MIEIINSELNIPYKGLKPVETEAGDWIDLKTEERVEMYMLMYTKISLGVAMQIPEGYEALVIPRSSTFERYGIILANSMGLIDENYCGEGDIWKFPALCLIKHTVIPAGSRIAQFRLIEHQPKLHFEEAVLLAGSDRGGFGSTGR